MTKGPPGDRRPFFIAALFLPDAGRYRSRPMTKITYDDFAKVDIRVGTIVGAEPFPEARKPAIKLRVNFGPEVGVRKSSAQIAVHYKPDELIGKQVAAVVNFPPRQIGPFMSEVLVLGFPDATGAVVLFSPDFKVPDGGKLF
jgi:tRNA-binding protein